MSKPSKKYAEGWSFGLRKRDGILYITEEYGKDGYTIAGEINVNYNKHELYFLFKDLKAFIRDKKRIKKL